MSFLTSPPEINSARIWSGAGSAPMLEAAAAWNGLAGELASASESFSSVTGELTGTAWQGPASTAMAASAARYARSLAVAAVQASGAASQAEQVAGAYETARAAMIHPAAVAANRGGLVRLVMSNFFGQNAPAIATVETVYEEMWAQDVTAMVGYHGSASASAAELAPWDQVAHTLSGLTAGAAPSRPEPAAGALGEVAEAAATTPLSVSPASANLAAVAPQDSHTLSSVATGARGLLSGGAQVGAVSVEMNVADSGTVGVASGVGGGGGSGGVGGGGGAVTVGQSGVGHSGGGVGIDAVSGQVAGGGESLSGGRLDTGLRTVDSGDDSAAWSISERLRPGGGIGVGDLGNAGVLGGGSVTPVADPAGQLGVVAPVALDAGGLVGVASGVGGGGVDGGGGAVTVGQSGVGHSGGGVGIDAVSGQVAGGGESLSGGRLDTGLRTVDSGDDSAAWSISERLRTGGGIGVGDLGNAGVLGGGSVTPVVP